jgi:hypothetical protein
MNGIVLLEKGAGRELLKKKCREVGVSVKVVERLVKVELEQAGKKTKNGINDSFEEILSCEGDEHERP